MRQGGASLSCQPIRGAELGARWRAASPIVRNREERGQGLADGDEMDGNRSGDRGKRGNTLHELPRMGDFLTERAIRRVFVDGIFVARCRRFVSSLSVG